MFILGESQSSLRFNYRIAQSCISAILPGVCDAIYEVLKDDYLIVPKTESEWIRIAENFNKRWNFPLCIGALDGKHVKICPPPGSGSHYYNYKGDFSVVLLALVNADTEFIYVDVGTNGRISDGGVWRKSTLKAALDSGMLNIPKCGCLPQTSVRAPYVIVADDAFPLCNNIMKPYAGKCLTEEKRIFNYRLSRARRVSENAFGILSARFRILRTAITANPENIKKIVLAICALHNFLKKRTGNTYPGIGDFAALTRQNSNFIDLKNEAVNPSNNAKLVQQRFCDYFNSVGAVKWQKELSMYH